MIVDLGKYRDCYYTTSGLARCLGLNSGAMTAIIEHAPDAPGHIVIERRSSGPTRYFRLGDVINWFELHGWTYCVWSEECLRTYRRHLPYVESSSTPA